MKLKIWQLPHTEETHGIIFMNYDRIADVFDFSKYLVVYENDNYERVNSLVPELTEQGITTLLEYIFRIFNSSNRPEYFKGHSLSVSDIVQIDNDFFYVDNFGFKLLSIDLSEEDNLQPEIVAEGIYSGDDRDGGSDRRWITLNIPLDLELGQKVKVVITPVND